MATEADALSGDFVHFHLGKLGLRDQRDTVRRLVVRPAPRAVPQRLSRGNAAVAIVEDDWSEF